MRQYRAGLAREKGPIATFLFIGPTGVGKTELAKTLAAIYFGGEEEVIRFDMVEYQDPKSTWNFIGSPDGEIPGNLTESIKKKPYTLLLLDEFEKAHYDILELFMPLFDEGRLKDSLGNIVDFTNTIIICTSNAHSNFIKEGIEKGTPISDIAIALKKKLTEYFKPELLNRFDDIIVFRQLTEDEIKEIAKLQLLQLAKRLEEEQGIQVAFTGDVAQLLANIGWDPVFGARPLRGVIREKIREVLAQEILKQNLQRGSRVLVKVSGKEFIFENL
jgi:ATP-dependent Clp protease ATP-binding subunit ClpA